MLRAATAFVAGVVTGIALLTWVAISRIENRRAQIHFEPYPGQR